MTAVRARIRLAALTLALAALAGCGGEEAKPEPARPIEKAPASSDRARAEALAARLEPAFDRIERTHRDTGEVDHAPLHDLSGQGSLVWSGPTAADRRPGWPEAGAAHLGGQPDGGTFTLEGRRLEAGVFRGFRAEIPWRGAGIALFRVLDGGSRPAWAGVFVPDAQVDALVGR